MKSEEELDLEDLQDQASVVGKLTPREYGRLRGIAPQLIYYHIRNGHIDVELCVCGRKVVDVARTDEALQERSKQQGRQSLLSKLQEAQAVPEDVRGEEG